MLAVVGSLFAATFFVAPRFSSLFKEEYPWEAMYPELVAQGVVVVAPGEAARGSTAWFRPLRLLDVRADGSRPLLPGAVALSLYRPIKA